MRTKTIELFQYAELSDTAKARARDWLREANQGDNFFAEYHTEEFSALLAALGFNIHTRAHGQTRSTLTWSGFSSQGDGAAFGGCWYASDCKPAAWLAERPVSFTDSEGNQQTSAANKAWHDVCAPIVALAAQFPHASAFIELSNRYNNMALDSFSDGLEVRDGDTVLTRAQWDELDATERATGERFIDAARDLAAQFYRDLEREYEYANSDACMAETIEGNEYEFTAEGKRAD